MLWLPACTVLLYIIYCDKLSELTAGLLLQQLSLAVDDTQDQQGQQHGGQSTADDRGQGHVPRAGHHRGQRHQVNPPTACGGEQRELDVRHSW